MAIQLPRYDRWYQGEWGWQKELRKLPNYGLGGGELLLLLPLKGLQINQLPLVQSQ